MFPSNRIGVGRAGHIGLVRLLAATLILAALAVRAPGQADKPQRPLPTPRDKPLIQAHSSSSTHKTATTLAIAQDQPDARLPRGVKAMWDLTDAYRETTPTRERICINGLWRFQPAEARSERAPAGNWGFFKVPGPWPEYRVRAWMAEESQKTYRHPSWEKKDLKTVDLVWHEREISVPKHWAGRRITLWTEWLNSYAGVCIDGKQVGEIYFPGGELDISAVCRPGEKQVLSLLVAAMPRGKTIEEFAPTRSQRPGANRKKTKKEPVGSLEFVLPTHWKGLPLASKKAPPENWETPGFDDASWRPIRVPGLWDEQYEEILKDRAWNLLHRVKFHLPVELANKQWTLVLGPVQTEDSTYVNGKLIGSRGGKNSPVARKDADRKYAIPLGVLRPGENVLAVRAFCWGTKGGVDRMVDPLLRRRQLKRLENVDAYLPAETVRHVHGLYLDQPYPYDDPYRYWRW